MVKKTLAIIVAILLCTAALMSCSGQGKEDSSSEAASSVEAASEETEVSSDPAEGTSAEAASADDASGSTEPEGVPHGPEDFSYGLTDNGFFDGIRAQDYIDIPDFSSHHIAKSDLEPTDEDIEQSISMLLSEYPEQITDRLVEDGDYVNIDYAGYMDGVQFDNGTAQGANVTAGSAEFIDDFLTQIIGHMPGETMDVKVTFPDPYQNNPDFAGKDAVFVVTINYIHGTPELTDEWVSKNLDGIRAKLYDDTIENAEDIRRIFHDYFYDRNMNEQLDKYMTEEVKAREIPQSILDISKKIMDINLYLNYGMTAQDFLDQGYASEEEINETYVLESTASLLYQAIAEQEGWTDISEADYGEVTDGEDAQELIGIYGKGYISKYVISHRAADYIVNHFTIEE